MQTCCLVRYGTTTGTRCLRDYVVEHLAEPETVLVIDETGDVKKGAQVGVHLTFAAAVGPAFIDWACTCSGAGRRMWPAQEVAVPAGVELATKPALAGTVIARALDAGTPARCVAGDEVYGADRGTRGRAHPPCRLRPGGGEEPPGHGRDRQHRAAELAAGLPARGRAAELRQPRREATPLVRLGPGRGH
jgi:hypothetical protein